MLAGVASGRNIVVTDKLNMAMLLSARMTPA
jgi:hypothetical protein